MRESVTLRVWDRGRQSVASQNGWRVVNLRARAGGKRQRGSHDGEYYSLTLLLLVVLYYIASQSLLVLGLAQSHTWISTRLALAFVVFTPTRVEFQCEWKRPLAIRSEQGRCSTSFSSSQRQRQGWGRDTLDREGCDVKNSMREKKMESRLERQANKKMQ